MDEERLGHPLSRVKYLSPQSLPDIERKTDRNRLPSGLRGGGVGESNNNNNNELYSVAWP